MAFIPARASNLSAEERKKGRALMESGILVARDDPTVTVLPGGRSYLEEVQGYGEVDPGNCRAEWQALRVQPPGSLAAGLERPSAKEERWQREAVIPRASSFSARPMRAGKFMAGTGMLAIVWTSFFVQGEETREIVRIVGAALILVGGLAYGFGRLVRAANKPPSRDGEHGWRRVDRSRPNPTRSRPEPGTRTHNG